MLASVCPDASRDFRLIPQISSPAIVTPVYEVRLYGFLITPATNVTCKPAILEKSTKSIWSLASRISGITVNLEHEWCCDQEYAVVIEHFANVAGGPIRVTEMLENLLWIMMSKVSERKSRVISNSGKSTAR